MPSAVKFPRITATTRLMNTNVAMTVKNGSANVEPQSLCGNASGSQPRASSIIASDMNADQPSPVRHVEHSEVRMLGLFFEAEAAAHPRRCRRRGRLARARLRW